MYVYHAFGLRIASELELPELHPGRGPADVQIDLSPSSAAPGDDSADWFDLRDNAVRLNLGGIGFLVENGRRILIQAPPDKAPADIRIWLLGTVAAALLHQRGYLPVHANVVAPRAGRAAAFAGDSGAGKSTLAAWFEGRGHRVLSDDLCAVKPGTDSVPCVFEGIPRAKLTPAALAALGRSSDGLQKVASDVDKFHVPIGRSATVGSLEPLELERFYVLDQVAGNEPFAIGRLTGAEAARAIVANAFRWSIGQEIQGPRAQFDQCVALARHAAVFRIARRWGLEQFAEDAGAIERHLLTPLADLAHG